MVTAGVYVYKFNFPKFERVCCFSAFVVRLIIRRR